MMYENLKKAILERRNIKPEQMNGRRIDDETVREILALANWAPTHGHTEPWRFTVFTGAGLQTFSRFHAGLYRQQMESEGKDPVKYDTILHRTDKVSHLVALGMKRGSNPKIPEQEELAAAAIAAYIVWLGAAARGLACYWGSGGMTYHPGMREFLGLGEADKVLGYLFLGYSDESPRGRRLTGIDAKTTWISG